jgi:hypothetical protein
MKNFLLVNPLIQNCRINGKITYIKRNRKTFLYKIETENLTSGDLSQHPGQSLTGKS